jgi:predicted lipid-binding transport protein (Tim44 family)
LPADIIIYALIAIGLILWLRSLLGMRPDDDANRPSPFLEPDKSARPMQNPASPAAPIATPRPAGGLNPDGTVNINAGLGRNMSISDAAQAGIMAIVRNDRTFDAGKFLTGAQDAFVMIVEAFAHGDRETLRNLLDAPLCATFESALAEREKNGEHASVEIHAVRHADIVDARLDNRTAYITVRFVADETNLLYAQDDTLLHGHPDRVTETIDIWTFTRDTRSRAPGWFLTATRDEDGIDKDVPDAGQG